MSVARTTCTIFILSLFFSYLSAGQAQQGQSGHPDVDQMDQLAQRRAQMQQDREEFEKAMEEQFQQSNDLIRQFFDEGEMESFQKNFRKMFRDFQNFEHIDDSIFNTPGMQQFMQQARGNRSHFEKQWVDGPENDQVTLVLKVKQSGKRPLNIKIENGLLKVNGTITQERKDANGNVISVSTSTIDSQESLGRDDILPDPINMVQDKDGNLRVVFKRKLAQKAPGRQQLKHNDDSPSI